MVVFGDVMVVTGVTGGVMVVFIVFVGDVVMIVTIVTGGVMVVFGDVVGDMVMLVTGGAMVV
jgi:hypothetical protein